MELLAEEARRNARWVTLAQPPIAMCFLRRGARPRSTVAEQPFYIVGPIEKAVEKARQLAGEEEPEQAADEPAETPEEARGPSRPRSEWRRTERNVKVTLTIPRPRAPIVRTLMIQRIAPWAFDDAISASETSMPFGRGTSIVIRIGLPGATLLRNPVTFTRGSMVRRKRLVGD